jgi:hypothetical protein
MKDQLNIVVKTDILMKIMFYLVKVEKKSKKCMVNYHIKNNYENI